MYWATPLFIIRLYKSLIWHGKRDKKVIYLTFDDGPTPLITKKVLDILDGFGAKATFFCLGRNVERNPELCIEILNKGHTIGNHSYSHLKGWRTPVKEYVRDVELAAQLIDSKLFRPPYGRIRQLQSKILIKRYRIIMWDVLSHDYNQKLPAKMCLRNVIRSTKNGSIVVFHDSVKASKNLFEVLPKFLEHFINVGYSFKPIQDNI
ncbi:MAG: polysaccharide deacetylase family protein [Bacteroidales bacterium]|nr:polysaccharide deacetylase family protein [Bacteroidales bacterium]MBN2817822.1 polysaccharide deacetylase family protein [Bacteroidales bacterium]